MTNTTERGGDLTFRGVDPETWPDLVRLFEAPGGPKHCWCLVWRVRGAQAHLPVSGRKALLEARVTGGEPIGILAYSGAGRDPVGWCSVAPRSTYRPIGGPPPAVDESAVWTVACFYVARRARRMGVGSELLRAAVAHAAARGATVVEGYPVAIDSPSFRFMGFVDMFLSAGFEYVAPVGSRRHLVRLRIAATAPPATREAV